MRSIFVVGMLLLLMAPSAFSQTPKLAVGASVGLEIPIVQDDQASGAVYGFRLRYQLMPSIAVEPNIYFSQYGDPESDEVVLNIPGSDVTAFGVDVILGSRLGSIGINPFFFAGLGFYEQTNEFLDPIYEPSGRRFGFSGGLGLGFGLSPKFDLEARAKLNVATSEGGGSKKSASILGGFNFNLGGQ